MFFRFYFIFKIITFIRNRFIYPVKTSKIPPENLLNTPRKNPWSRYAKNLVTAPVRPPVRPHLRSEAHSREGRTVDGRKFASF